jgi:D-alanyl-D-alanine carboxypeptidase
MDSSRQLSRRTFLRNGTIAGAAGLGALLLGRGAAASNLSSSSSRALPADRLQAVIDGKTREGAPGIVLHVETADGASWSGASGVRRLGGDRMTVDTLFPVFSVSKMAMATAALRLHEDRLLNLDDKISEYLSSDVVLRLAHAERVTVRQLVRQTSGFRDYFDEKFIGMLWADPTRKWRPEELVALASQGEPAGTPDDGDADYSNTNYVLLGLVMQQAAGQPLAQVLRQRVLNPLRMSQTASWEENTLRYEVAGYLPMGGEMVEVDGLDLSMAWGSGGLVSTAADVARLTRGMLTGDVLSKNTRIEVLNNFGQMKGRKSEYGYAVSRNEWGGTTLIGTTGEAAGYASGGFYEPSTGNTYAVLTNAFNETWLDVLTETLAVLRS